MGLMISVEQESEERVMRMLTIPLDEVLSAGVKDGALAQESKATELIEARIYKGNPPSPNYRRTGNALGGRIIKFKSDVWAEIIEDTRIKGAKKNYLPMLNINPKFPKFNTRYWDDTVQYVKENIGTILKESYEKVVKAWTTR